MRLLRKSAILLAAVIPLRHASAQQNNAAERLALARGLYYTPTADGLGSFQCDVHTDWKALLERGGQTVADDHPFLVYLRATRLTIFDTLNGAGVLSWTNTAPVPDGKDAAIRQMRDGMQQMFRGFFQSWNQFMNGSMVPVVDQSIMVRPDGDGVQLTADEKGVGMTEIYDRNMLLTSVHVSMPQMDVTAFPTYADSPHGRLVTSVRSLIKEPPSAPAIEITLGASYALVNSYMLPSSIDYRVTNVGQFHYTLSGCVINPK